MFLTHSSPFTIPENDHYAVKETIIFAADAFELEVEKEYKHEETTAPFEVQDVLPVVQIDDHVGMRLICDFVESGVGACMNTRRGGDFGICACLPAFIHLLGIITTHFYRNTRPSTAANQFSSSFP
jgi:hypothetical protein